VDDLRLPEEKRDAALAAARNYQENIGRMTDLANAGLLLRLKEVLSAEEFKALQEGTDRLRRGPGPARRLTTEDVVERIMSFDKNQDGKVTREELPERMQYLIDRGDTNKDGALDREEIRKLAAELAKEGSPLAGPGPQGRGAPGGPGRGLTLEAIERAVGELKLDEKKKELAASAVRAQREESVKLTTLVRSELLLQMSEILSGQEFKDLKAEVARQPGVGERPGGPPPGRPGRPGPPRP
jgi:hypothetical protein